MDTANFISQLDVIVNEFENLKVKSKYKDLSDLPKDVRQSLVSKSISAISRISGTSSIYAQEVKRILEQLPSLHKHTTSIIGIVKALREDIKEGYIQNVVELVHSEVFADFIEMAEHLLKNGYKDAAAVVAGSTLESHLKELCKKHGIDTYKSVSGKKIPKKADLLNSELVKATVYKKLDQKNVTAWLGLRNNAAHGNYSEYTKEQVAILISGISDFIARTPA